MIFFDGHAGALRRIWQLVCADHDPFARRVVSANELLATSLALKQRLSVRCAVQQRSKPFRMSFDINRS